MYIYMYIHIKENCSTIIAYQRVMWNTSAHQRVVSHTKQHRHQHPRPSTSYISLRSVIKLYVSFAEYRLLYRALLQKRLILLSILRTEATPHQHPRPSTSHISLRSLRSFLISLPVKEICRVDQWIIMSRKKSVEIFEQCRKSWWVASHIWTSHDVQMNDLMSCCA